jgi:ammonium transporter
VDKTLIDAFWLVICAAQVFLMQAGFVCLEAGLTRSKNNINVAVKNLTDLCIAIILFWAVGYSLMFGASYHGWGGTIDFLPDVSRMGAWPAAFLLFQIMFCGTAVTIISGATAERMRYRSYIITTIIVAGLIYPVFGHWAWNGIDTGVLSGWLGSRGFVDFAGSTVVHSVGGWVALAAVLVIGPRSGRFPDGGPPREIPGANLPLSVLGAVLLWFGWFGFNAGSALRLTEQVPMILINTALAGGAGLLAVLMIRLSMGGTVQVALLINGALAGLVAITASSNAVTPSSAMLIGLLGGVVMFVVNKLLIHFRIDDAVGAISVHLGAGIWGTLAVALFVQPDRLASGLDRWAQLQVQGLGVFICFVWTFGVVYLLLSLINRFFPLRVPPDSEHLGLNITEHGATTELLELFTAMDHQSRTGDLNLRVPVEPFTEVGQIADRHNQVIAALEQAVNRTAEIVDTAMDGIITFSTQTLIISSINPAAQKMFAWTSEGLCGQSILRLLELPSTQDATQQNDLQDACNWLSNRVGHSGPSELTGRRMDGTLFPVECLITETKFNDEQFYIGTFRDIFARKQMEEKLGRYQTHLEELIQERTKELEQAQKLAHMGNWYWDIVNDTSQWSEEIYAIYGLTKDFQPSYNKMLEMVHPQDRDRFQQSIQEVIEQVKPFDIEYRIVQLNGTERVVHVLAEIRTDENRQAVSMTGTVHDITERKQAEEALLVSEEQYRLVTNSVPICISYVDADLCYQFNNIIFEEWFGIPSEKTIGRHMRDVMGENVYQISLPYLKSALAGEHVSFEYEYQGQAKEKSVYNVIYEPRLAQDGSVLGIFILSSDITGRKQAETELRKLSAAIEQSHNAVLITDTNGNIEYINPKFTELTGYMLDEVKGKTPRILRSDKTPDNVYEELWSTISKGKEWRGKMLNKKKNGEFYWSANIISSIVDESGKITHFLESQEDITEIHHLTEKLTHQASHDALTNLINRREFEQRLDRVLESSHEHKTEHALCYLDLDQFKVINDTCGHVAGDELLRQLAGLLLHRLRQRDTLARLGGDEFGILMEHCSLNQARKVAGLILKEIEDFRFAWENQSFSIGVSIGIVAINQYTGSTIEILKEADAACYAAKDAGRNRIHVYNEDDLDMVSRHGEMQWVARINKTLEEKRFRLYAQPIVSLQRNIEKICFHEILLKMEEEDGTLISAEKFLPAAERFNLSAKLDRWVIETAFNFLKNQPDFQSQSSIWTINLSAQSLTATGFLDFVIEQLKDVDPKKICFEITETAAIANLSIATRFISIIKELGCQFALDDFGSGLSSFGYLKTLTVDYLKIDGIFVRDIVSDPIDRAMVKSINEIGQVMGLKTIAEFVENDGIMRILKDIGVNYGQGFGIGKPYPITEYREISHVS